MPRRQRDLLSVEQAWKQRLAAGDVQLIGIHPLKHALRFDASVTMVVCQDRQEVLDLAGAVAPDIVDAVAGLLVELPKPAFEALTYKEPTSRVLALAKRPSYVAADLFVRDDRPLVALANPRHQRNVGAVIRVSAAAGARGVAIIGDLDPWLPEAFKGSAGLNFALPVVNVADLSGGFIAFDPRGQVLEPARLDGGPTLLFGSERHGIPAELLDRADSIMSLPMQPLVSSLNLATSVSAVLYAWRLRQA